MVAREGLSAQRELPKISVFGNLTEGVPVFTQGELEEFAESAAVDLRPGRGQLWLRTILAVADSVSVVDFRCH